jgi:uncharacterized MAPEG superfamily protein
MGATNPAFVAYAITCIVLCLNLLLLWVSSGTSRARSGVAINPEDGARYNAPVADIDPPAVARILRAHRNAEATTYPFLLLGLVYVLAGATVWVATSIFIVFAVARIAHSIFYVRAVQPWRTIAFVISLLAILALIAALVLALLKA